ncbi:MAG: serine hydrolase [Candidatus Omnitrophota bacterium]|jgi:beta-lactamase class A
MIKKRFFFTLLSVFIFACCAYFSFGVYARFSRIKEEQANLRKKKAAWDDLGQSVRKTVSGYNGSMGLVLKDLSTGWTIEINKDMPFPSASLVKIPVMAAVFLAGESGKVDMNGVVTLQNRYKTGGSGSLKNMPAGKRFTVGDLVAIMITESDNTAANILIDLLGFEYLNPAFRYLGLENTDIKRKMMDFSGRKKGVENFTTAADQAQLLENIYRKKLLNGRISDRCLDILKQQKMHDRIPARLPRGIEIAHKTGLEQGVCHDAGIVFTPQGDFLICALIKHNDKISRPAKRMISRIALDAYNYTTGERQNVEIRQAQAGKKRDTR